jgi:hypothetical protein
MFQNMCGVAWRGVAVSVWQALFSIFQQILLKKTTTYYLIRVELFAFFFGRLSLALFS